MKTPLFYQARAAINLVSDNRWQRAVWWLRVIPGLIFFTIATSLGFYKEEGEE